MLRALGFFFLPFPAHLFNKGFNKEINKIREEVGFFFLVGHLLGGCVSPYLIASPLPKRAAASLGGVCPCYPKILSVAVPRYLPWMLAASWGARCSHPGMLPIIILGCSQRPSRDAPHSHPRMLPIVNLGCSPQPSWDAQPPLAPPAPQGAALSLPATRPHPSLLRGGHTEPSAPGRCSNMPQNRPQPPSLHPAPGHAGTKLILITRNLINESNQQGCCPHGGHLPMAQLCK